MTSGGVIIPDFKFYCVSIIVGHDTGPKACALMEHSGPYIIADNYTHRISEKDAKSALWRKDGLFR